MLEPCIDEHMTRRYYSTFVLSIQTCSSLLSEFKRSIWASLSSQSNTWVFAMIRDCVSDLGKGMKLVRQHSLVLCSPSLQTPPYQNLSPGLATFHGDGPQRRIRRFGALHHRRIGLESDIMLLAVCHDVVLLTPWMQLQH